VSLALVAEIVAGLYRLAETLPNGNVNDPLNVLRIGPETKLLALPAVEEAVLVKMSGFAAVVTICLVVNVSMFVTVRGAFNVRLFADFATLRL
jgi:hypothetical protein